MKTKLIQLGSGDFVDPSKVVSLQVFDASEGCKSRLVVVLENGDRLVDNYSSQETARYARDLIAKAINDSSV